MTAPLYEGASAQELDEEIQGLKPERLTYLRRLAQHDLIFMAHGVLGYTDVNPETHGAFARFIQHHPKIRRLGLMPRGHLKSTIATIADSVRLACLDPNETRILIVNETASNAEGFLSEVKSHFVNGELLRMLFPELLPEKMQGPGSQWSMTMASVRRTTAYKEGTWTALGVGGAAVSRHYTRIKADDLIGLEADNSPAVMESTKKWVGNIESLISDANKDIIDFIGTRWSLHDLYATIMRDYGEDLAVFSRAAIENGNVIFPAKFNMRFFDRLRTNQPLVWHAQYENNPISGGVRDLPAARTFAFEQDGSVSFKDQGHAKVWKRTDLDIVILVDVSLGGSASSDYCAIIVVGTSPDDEVFVLKSRIQRLQPSELVDAIFDEVKTYRPRVVGIEKAGQQSTQHYFEKKAREELIAIRAEPLKHYNKEKTARIRAGIEPLVRSGRLFTLTSQATLNQAIQNFPDLEWWDELDALAYYPQIARTPLGQEEDEENNKAEQLIIARRGIRTGYGS